MTVTDFSAPLAVGERLFDPDCMFAQLQAFADSRGLPQTSRALPYARQQHSGQFRKGSSAVPYIVHPLSMACHALALGLTEDDLLAAALLHDVCEDCGVAPEELPAGMAVREAVRALTFFQEPGEDRHAAKARYFAALSSNRTAVLVKLLDRCNNVSFMAHGFPPEKLHAYIAETREFVLPLLGHARQSWPQYHNALFLLQYQICTLIDSVDILLKT